MLTNSYHVNLFLEREIAECEENNIKVNLAPVKFLKCGSLETCGWFDEDSLQVAIQKPLEEWLPVFVHESCHKDQFLENSPAWDTKIKDFDALNILDMWLENIVELKDWQLEQVINKAQQVELDCEKRSVLKIEKYNLPINIENYIKKSCVYMWFYRTLPLTRKWYPGVYNIKELLNLMPTNLEQDFNKLPKQFHSTMLAHFGE